ncbi:MAG: hypothetical protein HYU39_06650 [Thaumarchaeota archaeon]|nr:hypothetical protein [Nitrososphaerota archaeon]
MWQEQPTLTEESHPQQEYTTPRLRDEVGLVEELKAELAKLGLTQNEARAYAYLLRTGPKKASDVSKSTGIHRTETYHILTGLQNKGLVSGTFTYPLMFVATPLQKALDLLVSLEKDRIKYIESRKEEMVSNFGSLPALEQQEQTAERFIVLANTKQSFSTAVRILEAAKSSIWMVGNDQTTAKLYHHGFFEASSKSPTCLDLRLVGEISDRSNHILDEIKEAFTIKRLQIKPHHLPNFVLVDSSQLLIFPSNGDGYSHALQVIYTTHASLTNSMKLLFDFLWKLSDSPID